VNDLAATPSSEDLPLVSVIMPVCNEAQFIERSLGSVMAQDYPSDRLEILVADGMSDDATQAMVAAMADRDPRIRLVRNHGRIVSTGMNAALRESKGEVFVRIDGHCEIPADFIRKSVESLLENLDAWVVGGSWRTVSAGAFGRAIAAATQSPIGVGNAKHRLGNFEGWVDTVPYGAHHRWVLDRVGFFDEQLVRNQDDEFNLRIRLAGGKIWMSKDIQSTYYSRASLGKLWRQYFQYGFWRIRTIQKHRRAATVRQTIPLQFVASLLLLAMLTPLWIGFAWLLLAEAALYAAAVLYGSLDILRRAGLKSALLGPIVFPVLHFGYGLGCLWGIVRFMLLQGAGLPKPETFAMSR
jgi:succinoglycan biosynthesis protein ExoA